MSSARADNTAMGSSLGARVLLVVGFLAAFIGYDAWILSHVVLDPNTTRAAAHALLEAPAVRRGLADEVTKEIDRQVPAAAQYPQLAANVAVAMRDPRVATAFADTVANIHRAILANGSARTFTVDGRALTAAVHDALAPHNPHLAAQIERVPPIAVSVKTDKLPRLRDPRSTTNAIAVLGIVAALLLITASLLLQHDRRSIARIGRRVAYLALTPLLVFVVLPHLLGLASGDAPEIASALLRVYGGRVLPSAIGLLIAGIVLAVGAIVWPRYRTAAAPPGPPAPPPYTGPPPTPRPRGAPDQPAITEKLYL